MAEVVWTLVRTDFKSRYHGSLGGYLWALAKPLAMFGVLMVVFGTIFRMDPDYRLNLVIGLFVYDFFSEATRSGLGALHRNGFLVTRAAFPRWIPVLTSSSNALVTLGLFLAVCTGYVCLFRAPPGAAGLALLVLYVLAYVAIAVGISLAASVLFLRFRDLNEIWDLALQAGFFVAPVVYPLDIVPHQYHFYLYVWPPTPIIQFARMVLVEGEIPTFRAHLMLLGVTLSILAVGVATFRKLGPRAVERL